MTIPTLIAKINKIVTPVQVPTPVTKAKCEELKENGYPINACDSNTDYWAGAVQTCKDNGYRLPTDDDLTKIAQYLYNDPSIGNDYKEETLDTSKIPSALSGLGSSLFLLWSGSEGSATTACRRGFYNLSTYRTRNARYNSLIWMVCVTD